MKHILVFTADVHGNEAQYRKLVDYALQVRAGGVIIGGDIAPKGASLEYDFIGWQRQFLEEQLPALLQPLKEAGIPVFLIMGNDDCRVNGPVLGEVGYQTIHGRRIRFAGDIDIVGYSCVPVTPFMLKDWEKFDFSLPPEHLRQRYEHRKQANYNRSGVYSQPKGMIPVRLGVDDEMRDSVQRDLQDVVYRERPDKTVYVMHSPPNDTALDVLMDGMHAGSFAIRQFIEEAQPLMTLHGHIHETVDMSRRFGEKIWKTYCFSAGNDNSRPKLAVVIVDVYKPEEAQRVVM